MRIGKACGLCARLGFDMTPMIDVCFQLIIFFMLSLRIFTPEGDFNVKMPMGVGGDYPTLLPIVIRMEVSADHELDTVQIGTRPPLVVRADRYLATFREKYKGQPDAEQKARMAAHEAAEDDVFAAVRTVVRSLVKRQGRPDSGPGSIDAAEQEVEISADPRLKFRCVIKTINAVSGFREGAGKDSQVVKMIDKIRFSPPRKSG